MILEFKTSAYPFAVVNRHLEQLSLASKSNSLFCVAVCCCFQIPSSSNVLHRQGGAAPRPKARALATGANPFTPAMTEARDCSIDD